MRTIFVVNPYAGRGRGAAVADTLPRQLADRGLSGEIVRTDGPLDAVRRARDAAERADVVVAVGGDGTAHEVVNGLAETGAAFGLIPVGSGNDMAYALGIPTEPEAAVDVLAAGRRARIDLGRYDDGWFANSLGLGFEAQVTIESRTIRGLRGFAIYLAAVAKALAKLRCPDLVLRTDDTTYRGRRLLVCVGNGPRVGGGFLLTPDALPEDGIFDVCLADAIGRVAVLGLLPKSLSGTHVDDPRITMTRTRTLAIESSDGFPFHADGEVRDTARRSLHVELHPAKLEVIAGPGGPGDRRPPREAPHPKEPR